jgi:single-strand DNA-binding protein
MATINKVILIGNLGADPEVRYTPSGDAVCTIRMATTSKWKDRSTGEGRESAEWHRVIFYRKLAEIAGQYLSKGASIYVEGKLKTRKWNGSDGRENKTTEIEANEMQILSEKSSPQKSNDEQIFKVEKSAIKENPDWDVPF